LFSPPMSLRGEEPTCPVNPVRRRSCISPPPFGGGLNLHKVRGTPSVSDGRFPPNVVNPPEKRGTKNPCLRDNLFPKKIFPSNPELSL